MISTRFVEREIHSACDQHQQSTSTFRWRGVLHDGFLSPHLARKVEALRGVLYLASDAIFDHFERQRQVGGPVELRVLNQVGDPLMNRQAEQCQSIVTNGHRDFALFSPCIELCMDLIDESIESVDV